MNNSITSYSELLESVENDTENHKLKEIAELFLSAMNDWPNCDLESIEKFTAELNDFFGSPLTLQKLDSKKIDFEIENNSWRAETKSQIAEMIDYSKLYYDESNFENIVSKIISYYSNKRASR